MEERCGVTAVSLVSTLENILKNEHLVPTGARFDFGGEAFIHIKDATDGEEASRELVSEITPLRKNGSCARKKRTPFGICNARGKTSK